MSTQESAVPYKVVESIAPDGRTERVYAGRHGNLDALLNHAASRYGDRKALMDRDLRLSYRQLASSIDTAASALYHQFGIRKGDRIALMLQNGVEFVTAFFAGAKIGAITAPLNTALKGEELSFQLKDSGAVLLIIEQEFFRENELQGMIPGTGSGNSGVAHIVVSGGRLPKGTAGFSELMKERQLRSVNVTVDENDIAVLMYTSGTTGQPKGALLSHKGFIASAMNTAALCGLGSGRDTMLMVAPLFHITGLAMVLGASVYAGIPVAFIQKFKAVDTLKTIEKEKITHIIAVPTIFWLLLNDPEFNRFDLGSIRFLACGGSACPEDLLKCCAEKLPGVQLAPGYGLTEANGMTHTTRSLAEASRHAGSVGRAVSLIDAKIVDGSGREAPPDHPGELLVRGCQVMKGYWNNPAATRETLVDGWLRTGDIGKLTEDGYLTIFDRMKDMIIRGGENIYSIEVENVLYRNPKVFEAAVVGTPDPVFGEQVKAVVVLRPEEKATPEEIRAFCGKYLARFKVPRSVEFRESLPRNPAGKVKKDQLK
jgi:acyl-CoA synthetase (AMP-forming)/AMP-acid ligase II